MFQSDVIFEQMKNLEQEIKEIEITDSVSISNYLCKYTELIYNYKCLGNLYDIYDDKAIIYMENGKKIIGPHDMVKEAIIFHSTFPDAKITMVDSFAVSIDDCYKVWRNYYITGTCLGYSVYGEPTNKKLEENNCIVLSMATMKKIKQRYRITQEYCMTSAELLRNVCTKEEHI